MRYPPRHREQTKKRILQSARALFNRHGFTDVSIDDVMEHAGLTRGGFYTHFATKSALYAETVGLALAETPWSRGDGIAARDVARQIIEAYLSQQHIDDLERACPMLTLPSDVARSDDALVRDAFEKVFSAMAGLFEEGLNRNGRADRTRALAMASLCVGAMVVARALRSDELSSSIREAAKETVLAMGGWQREASSRRSAAPMKPQRRKK